MSAEPLVIDHIGVQIGALRLLDEVSVAVEPGQYVAIVGASGAGKTTLLRAIAGFVPLATGTIGMAGERWCEGPRTLVPPQRRRIGMIAQDLALWPHLTVRQHMAVTLRWRGFPRAQRASAIAAMLDRVELTPRQTHRPAELSGGEAQRLALARALAGHTRLLLLDEPFAQLDVLLRRRVAEQVRTIARDMQATVLHVTHDPTEALTADRVWVFQAAKLVRDATPSELRTTDDDPFVTALVAAAAITTTAHRPDARPDEAV